MTILKSTIELLELITPIPYGQGLSQVQAAKILKITDRQIRYRLQTLQKRQPDAYNNYISLRSAARLQDYKVQNPISISDLHLETLEVKQTY